MTKRTKATLDWFTGHGASSTNRDTNSISWDKSIQRSFMDIDCKAFIRCLEQLQRSSDTSPSDKERLQEMSKIYQECVVFDKKNANMTIGQLLCYMAEMNNYSVRPCPPTYNCSEAIAKRIRSRNLEIRNSLKKRHAIIYTTLLQTFQLQYFSKDNGSRSNEKRIESHAKISLQSLKGENLKNSICDYQTITWLIREMQNIPIRHLYHKYPEYHQKNLFQFWEKLNFPDSDKDLKSLDFDAFLALPYRTVSRILFEDLKTHPNILQYPDQIDGVLLEIARLAH